jgi:hypothetical protein
MGRKKQRKPISISKCLEQDIRWELEGSVDGAIQTLQFYQDKYGADYTLSLDVTEYNSYGDRWPVIELYGSRLETEDEMNKRYDEEQTRLDKQEEAERLQYEKLRRKYESD